MVSGGSVGLIIFLYIKKPAIKYTNMRSTIPAIPAPAILNKIFPSVILLILLLHRRKPAKGQRRYQAVGLE